MRERSYLNQDVSAILALCSGDELGDEGIICRATETRLTKARVKDVVDDGGSVTAYIDLNRQALRRMDTRTSRVQGQLSNRDAHAVPSQITQTQNALPIGEANDFDVVVRPVVEDLSDMAGVVAGDVQPAGLVAEN